MATSLLELPKKAEVLFDRNSFIPFVVPARKVDSKLSLDSSAQILYRLINEKASGRIVISDPRDAGVSWQIWMGNGQIHFATSLVGQFERLLYLQRYVGFSLPPASLQQSDYQFLCSQWQSGRLSLGELRTALTLITQDSLIQILKLPQAAVRLEPKLGLDPLLISEPIQKLLSPILPTLRRWQKAQPEILSPLQRPVVIDRIQFNQLRLKPEHNLSRFLMTGSFLDRDYCLYQIAQQLRVSVSQLVPVMKSLVQQGIVEMRPYATPQAESRSTVACLDTDLKLQATVQTSLEAQGYKVLPITEPTHVWSALSRNQPDLLLLDIDRFDGYSFLRTILHSEQFKTMPVVTLTERPSGMHRFWARRAGAVDCWVKPFESNRLQTLVQQIRLPYAAAC